MAPTQQKQAVEFATVALTEAINTLNGRILKTETDFLGHLQKVEDRLDQIVDLTKTVALLQQATSQQTDTISEVRMQLRESSNKFDTSIARIHTRLDEISTHQRDKIELVTKEHDIKVEAVKVKAENTDKELKAWLNRGWGAWAIMLLVLAAVQTGFYRWIDGIEKEKQASVITIQSLAQSRDKIEIFVKTHENEAIELKGQVKKLNDSQRDLEDLVTRRTAPK